MSAALEGAYKTRLIKKIYRLLPDCEVLKNDANYRQGIPDLTVYEGPYYAMLETKRKTPRPGSDDFEPNQEWYLEHFNRKGFAACVYPANEAEVLREMVRYLTRR